MSVLIRPGTRADVPAVLAIYNEALATTTATWDHEPVTLADRLARFDAAEEAGRPLLVAQADDEVVGYGTYGPFRAKRGWSATMEHSVYLAPAARGRGLGTLLLAAVIEAARARGVHVLVGVVDATNEASVRLHLSAGFTEAGRMPQAGFKFGRWLDALFLQLILDAAPPPA